MATDPWMIDAASGSPSYAANEVRLVTVVPFVAGAGASLGVRTGVRPSGSGTDLLVQAQTSPDMTVKVNPGVIIVQGGISSTQGAYAWALDTVTNRTISAAHASLARTDLVVVRIRDAGVDTSGQRDGDVTVITGTAGGGVPSLPTDATYVTIAQVAVPAGATSITTGNITDRRPFTAAPSAIICTSSTKPSASSTAPGQLIYVSDYPATARLQYSDGSNWQYVNPFGQAVSVDNTGLAPGTTTSTSFTSSLTGAGTVSRSFTAPPSGVVFVSVGGVLRSSSASERVLLGWQLSGASSVSADDENSALTLSTSDIRVGGRWRVTGLTASGSYTATLMHRVTGGTGTFDDRVLIVEPGI